MSTTHNISPPWAMNGYPMYAGDPTGTAETFVGYCRECHTVKAFNNPRTRDLWKTHHPHDDEQGEQ